MGTPGIPPLIRYFAGAYNIYYVNLGGYNRGMTTTPYTPGSPGVAASQYVTPGTPTWEKRAWLQETKVQRGCHVCGYREHAEALDYHHVRGPKLFSLSLACATRAWAPLRAEVAKCVVICANCHRVQTARVRAARNATKRDGVRR